MVDVQHVVRPSDQPQFFLAKLPLAHFSPHVLRYLVHGLQNWRLQLYSTDLRGLPGTSQLHRWKIRHFPEVVDPFDQGNKAGVQGNRQGAYARGLVLTKALHRGNRDEQHHEAPGNRRYTVHDEFHGSAKQKSRGRVLDHQIGSQGILRPKYDEGVQTMCP